MADRVFEDRVGLIIVNTANLPDRLPKIKAFGGGLIRDLFLPRSCTLADIAKVRNAGLSAHLFVAVDGLTADALVDRTLADLTRVGTRGVELNIELNADAPLPAYVRDVVGGLRTVRPGLRMRLNFAPWKGFAIPADLLAQDPSLYACSQTALGNMDELLSPQDVSADLRAHGCPEHKLTVCYSAACTVLGSAARQRTLPDLSRVHRGVIYQDDLMHDAGLLA